jgi:hypothetical protein
MDEWDDERMDIIGQNGNDGLHYNSEEFLKDGWVDNKEELINFEFTMSEVDQLVECIKSNATLPADVKENLLVNIRRRMNE